jgi:hypothetical protein
VCIIITPLIKNEGERNMNHWDSYKDDPFFYEQAHDAEEKIDNDMGWFYEQDRNAEERIDDNMGWAENNAQPNVPMPNVPMPAAPMPPVQMPIAYYPPPPMFCCPPVSWCDPMVGGMTSFADADFDGPDMTPPPMPLGMPAAPHTAMGGAGLPTSENADPVTAPMMPTGGTFAPSPMFPAAGMVPTVPFPISSPMMPFGVMPTVHYTPISYYGGMAPPYGPFFPVPYR